MPLSRKEFADAVEYSSYFDDTRPWITEYRLSPITKRCRKRSLRRKYAGNVLIIAIFDAIDGNLPAILCLPYTVRFAVSREILLGSFRGPYLLSPSMSRPITVSRDVLDALLEPAWKSAMMIRLTSIGEYSVDNCIRIIIPSRTNIAATTLLNPSYTPADGVRLSLAEIYIADVIQGRTKSDIVYAPNLNVAVDGGFGFCPLTPIEMFVRDGMCNMSISITAESMRCFCPLVDRFFVWRRLCGIVLADGMDMPSAISWVFNTLDREITDMRVTLYDDVPRNHIDVFIAFSDHQ